MCDIIFWKADGADARPKQTFVVKEAIRSNECSDVSTLCIAKNLMICCTKIDVGKYIGISKSIQELIYQRQGKLVWNDGFVGFSEIHTDTNTAILFLCYNNRRNTFGGVGRLNDVLRLESFQFARPDSVV